MKQLYTTIICLFTMAVVSCSDDEGANGQLPIEQPEQLPELIAQYNTNISAYQALMDGKAEIIDFTSDESGNYKLQLSNQQIADVYACASEDKDIPLLGIDEEGYWNYQLEGSTHTLTDLQGNPAPAMIKT